jgi:hypothetical protein
MEFIERLSLRPVYWLSQLSYADFVEKCINKKMTTTTKDCEALYTLHLQFCKNNIKHDGVIKRIYSYSTEGLSGRLFCGGSLQSLPCTIRGLLMHGIGTDIDMANAHPIILRYICRIHRISCPQLEYYINHRDECLANFESREIGKVAYLKSLNKDTLSREKGLPTYFKKYDSEIKQIQKQIVKIKEYKKFVDAVPDSKTYNKLGSAMNRIMCHYENTILQHAIHIIQTRGLEIAILMFDGLMVYGDYYKDKGLLDEITAYVEKQMPGLEMKWAYKEHNTELSVPEDFVVNSLTYTPNFVCNDLEAAQKIYALYPYWKYSENGLYVFDDTAGLWKNDRNTHNVIVTRFTNDLWVGIKGKNNMIEASDVKSYGNTTTLFIQLLDKLKTLCIDDNWLKRSASSSLGKLLFNNGYFDLHENVFYNTFNPEIVFAGKIYQDYNPIFTLDEEIYIESIKRRLFYEPLGKNVGDFFILNLARGLAGDMLKRIMFGLGASNTGKSTITKALLKACSDYVGTFDGNNFAYRNTSNDSASQNRWLMLLKNKRIIFSNEIKSTIPLNGNLIKMVSSGGDAVVGRHHAGNESEFYLSFLCVVFANDLPKIMPYDDAVSNRVRVVSYTKPYVENPANDYELQMDANIDTEINTLLFQRCFLEIFIKQYHRGRKGEFKIEPMEVTQAKEEWIGTDVGCLPSFLQEYEITNDEKDFVKSSEIQEWLELGKFGITMKKFGMELKQYTIKHKLEIVKSIVKKIDCKTSQVWIGIKKN